MQLVWVCMDPNCATISPRPYTHKQQFIGAHWWEHTCFQASRGCLKNRNFWVTSDTPHGALGQALVII